MDQVISFTDSFKTDHPVTISAERCPECTYAVSKAVLQAASPCFQRPGHLPQSLGAACEQKYILPACDVETLQLFIYYLFNGHMIPQFRLEYERVGKECNSYQIRAELKACGIRYQTLLAKLWCLAERLSMPRLQDIALYCLQDLLQVSEVTVEAMEETFGMTEDGSVLREMMVSELVWRGKRDWYSSEEEHRLGKIPDLIRLYLKKRDQCPGDCGHTPHCAPSVGGVEAYLVFEADTGGKELVEADGI